VSVAADPTLLRRSVLRILEAENPEGEKLLADLELHAEPGQPVYSSILHALTHLDFTEPQARKHWQQVRLHRATLTAALGRDAGLRVAMLDYFVNVCGELRNPKVIEIALYRNTERRALTDGLTGLFNRAYFQQALRREVQRARRNGTSVSLIMMDLDNFKHLNDTRGHVAGDRALVKAAALVKDCVRDIDTSARYGGEEFAVILPETAGQGAFVVAERIRSRIEAQFRGRKGPGVTVSGGIATLPDDALEAEQLIMQADKLLYRSKAEGKNRITYVEASRRRFERLVADYPVAVNLGHDHQVDGHTLNVSEGGLLLELPEPVEVGRRLQLSVRIEDARVLALRGLVVRSAEAANRPSAYELALRLLSDPNRNRELLVHTREGNA
jgi:diguanylate cyclase (GGDEF)-like protein